MKMKEGSDGSVKGNTWRGGEKSIEERRNIYLLSASLSYVI
jgi:hypothetical protein